MVPVSSLLRFHLLPRQRTNAIVSFSSINLITSRLSTSVAASSSSVTTASNNASSSRVSAVDDIIGQDINNQQQLASLHIPVMCNEVLRLWMPEKLQQQNQHQSSLTPPSDSEQNKTMYLIDGTLGLGGHTSAMLAHAAASSTNENHSNHQINNINVRVLGIDRDKSSLIKAQRRIENDINSSVSSSSSSSMVSYYHGSFANLSNDILRQYSFPTSGVHGILVDLGMNSDQIHDTKRGFTFRKSAPLDMRYDTRGGILMNDDCIRAEIIVNTWSVDELCYIFTRHANEIYAYEIASAIVHWRDEKIRGVRRAGQHRQQQRRGDNSIRSTLELRYIIEETVAALMTDATSTAATATISKKVKYSVNDEDVIQKKTTTTTTINDKYTKYRYIWHRLPNTHELTKVKRDKLLFKYQECKPRYTEHVMRCFQALRIASNNELYHIEQLFTILTPSALTSTLPPKTSQQGEEERSCCCCLAIGGHFVAIAFHPGEDEIIKLGMKRLVDTGQYKYLTPQEDGLRPTYDEIKSNSRSRTARLRAVERIR
jgi:16S rRNA C1402 N4-methylase RsmH